MDKQKYWFFGSKLNTFLLLVLIILMVIALKWMARDKEKYLPVSQTPTVEQVNRIEGNKEDLVSFSIKPGQEVSGKMKVTGSVKGGYFFEANIIIGLLDANKNRLPYGPGHANATSDWMTAGPVSFAFDIDFGSVPKGPAYLEIHNDNASGLPENDKHILIPVFVK